MTPEDFKHLRELCKIHITAMHGHMRLAAYMKKIIEDVQKGTATLMKENAADGGTFLAIFKKEQDEAKKVEWKLALADAPVPTGPAAPTTTPTAPPPGTSPQTGTVTVSIIDKADKPFTEKVKVVITAQPERGKLDVQKQMEIHNPDGRGVFSGLPLDRVYLLHAETADGFDGIALPPYPLQFTTSLDEGATLRINDELNIELLTYVNSKSTEELGTRDEFIFRIHGAKKTLAWVCTVTDPKGRNRKMQGTAREARVPIYYDQLGNYIIKLEVDDGRKKDEQREVECHATQQHQYTLFLDVENRYAISNDMHLDIDGSSHRFIDGQCVGLFVPGDHLLHDSSGVFEDATFKLEAQLQAPVKVKKKLGSFTLELRDIASNAVVPDTDVQLEVYVTEATGLRLHPIVSARTDASGVAVIKDVPLNTAGAMRINQTRKNPLYEQSVFSLVTDAAAIVHHIMKASDIPAKSDLEKFIDRWDEALSDPTPVHPLEFDQFKDGVYKFIRDHYLKLGADAANLTDKFVEQVLHMLGYDEPALFKRWVELDVTRYYDVEHFVTEWLHANPKRSENDCVVDYGKTTPHHKKYAYGFVRTVTREDIALIQQFYRAIKAAAP